MPTKTFSIGKDCTLVLIAPNGQRLDLPGVTGFDAKQEVHKLKRRPLNGPPQNAHLPDGWEGSFDVDRVDSAVDDLFSQIERGYWAGGSVGTGRVYQYVQEPDGSESTYLFDGVAMYLANAGSYKSNSEVKQQISFSASSRERI